MKTKKRAPDFICIGAQKSATTWLYEVLRTHPSIYLPPVKEIHYFDRAHTYSSPTISFRFFNRFWRKRFVDFLRCKDKKQKKWLASYLFGIYNNNWYLSLFSNATINNKCGEITPSYSILDVDDIKKVYAINPELKVVFLMRNPVDRAWSQFLMFLRFKKLQLSDVSAKRIISMFKTNAYFNRGNYPATIKKWSTIFPEKNILNVFYDEVAQKPDELLKKILKHIEVDSSYICPSLIKKKVFQGQGVAIPLKYSKFLNNQYKDSLNELNKIIKNPIIGKWIETNRNRV